MELAGGRALAVDRLTIALITRPSQPGEGRTAGRGGCYNRPAATAHSLKRRKRISSALAPENPTNFAGDAGRLTVSISTRAPTDMVWIGPATSTSGPHADHGPYTSIPSSSRIWSASAFMLLRAQNTSILTRLNVCLPHR